VEINAATAQILVTRPVLIENKINFLIIVSDLLTPVRDICSIEHKIVAMRTSPAAARALTVIDATLSVLNCTKFWNCRLLIV